MPKIEIWGKHTWIFLHTLSFSLKEESFSVIGQQLLSFIKRICGNLPCSDCSNHATIYFSKIPENTIKSKTDLINLLYNFHNIVNVRKKKPVFSYESLMETYSKTNITISYMNFLKVYNTNGDMKNLSQTFTRETMMKQFKSWLFSNISHFSL